jgi:hypothetical protein
MTRHLQVFGHSSCLKRWTVTISALTLYRDTTIGFNSRQLNSFGMAKSELLDILGIYRRSANPTDRLPHLHRFSPAAGENGAAKRCTALVSATRPPPL